MPTIAETFALALQHHQAGNLRQAEQLYQQILHADPGHAEAHNLLGMLAYQMGRIDEALTHCRHVLRLRPDAPEAHNNLGNALRSQGKLEEAVIYCRQALSLRPDFAEAHNNLGTALAELERPDEAVASLREAVRINPNFAEAWSNLGNALALLDQLDEAVRCYQQAIRLKPADAGAFANLGHVRVQQGHFDEGQACFDEALRRAAGHPQAHFNQALLWLLLGKWTQGWPEYEWRLQTKEFPRYAFRQPRWDGEPQAGRTLLLLAEQGLGDTLLFSRYLPLVKERVGTVIVQCQPPLQRLLAGVRGIDHMVAKGSPLPAFDAYASFFSLPDIFQTTLATVPATVPYLHSDAKLVAHWRRELNKGLGARDEGRESSTTLSSLAPRPSPLAPRPSPLAPFLVGIAWQGNPAYNYDRQRSIPLAHFARLAQVKEVQLISLQKGPGAEQLGWTVDSRRWTEHPSHRPLSTVHCPPRPCGVLDLGDRLDEASGPFMDTAAIMRSLDLVISSDTAVAHLAGALGIPVWVALPLVPDWRWLLQREDSPWYPTMRLFRQTRYGHWDDVFDRMARELTRITRSPI